MILWKNWKRRKYFINEVCSVFLKAKTISKSASTEVRIRETHTYIGIDIYCCLRSICAIFFKKVYWKMSPYDERRWRALCSYAVDCKWCCRFSPFCGFCGFFVLSSWRIFSNVFISFYTRHEQYSYTRLLTLPHRCINIKVTYTLNIASQVD